MLIYRDIFSEDELCSDSYKVETVADGCLLKIKGKLQTETTTVDDSAIGGNKSEESPGDDNADPSSVTGVNIVLAHRLVETAFDKKGYMSYIKGYIARVVAKLEGNPELPAIKAALSNAVKDILKEFKEYQFFMGESMNDEGMILLMKYDDETPYVYLFKHGIIEEKC